jgi:hypothetical protein
MRDEPLFGMLVGLPVVEGPMTEPLVTDTFSGSGALHGFVVA